MPYYTFKVPSTNKNVLAKQFSTQDCIDLHFLLANEDFEGVDLFCEKKFLEYTGCSEKINSLDRFLFLFSQKILSHTFDISVNHVITPENKTSVTISLVNIYNNISDKKFIFSQVYSDENIEIEYSIPTTLSSKQEISLQKIKVKDEVIEVKDSDSYNVEDLPFEVYNQASKMMEKNNELIKFDYFKKGFLRELEFNNQCFLFILDFVYTENVANYYHLLFNLCKEYNISFEHIKSTTMRELQLIVDTINTINQEKKKQQKVNERLV